jgi:putative tryptophan/tyrosine transport system substrate-binding protein
MPLPSVRSSHFVMLAKLDGFLPMRRRHFLALIAAFVARPLGSIAHASNPPRIGWLWSGRSANNPNEVKGFQQGLRDLGYVEGQNVVIDYRFGEGSEDKMGELAAELVRLRPDVLVVIGPPALTSLIQTGTMIPIVAATGDLDSFVASLARPGGRITGTQDWVGNLSGKRLQLLKEAIPTLNRVGLLTNPKFDSGESAQVDQIAAKLGINLQTVPVHVAAEIKPAISDLKREGVEAMIYDMTPPLFAYQQEVASQTLELKLPTISEQPEFAEGGGLISYGASIFDDAYREAYFVDRILKGAKPADLPVQQPTKFEMVINLATAKALGLEAPPTLLARADEVIE